MSGKIWSVRTGLEKALADMLSGHGLGATEGSRDMIWAMVE
jgi:hypothetical protein